MLLVRRAGPGCSSVCAAKSTQKRRAKPFLPPPRLAEFHTPTVGRGFFIFFRGIRKRLPVLALHA